MNRDEMRKIIADAMDTYGWVDFITNAIAEKQPKPDPDHDDSPVIIALRRRLAEAEREADYHRRDVLTKEEHKVELRDEVERLKNSIDFLRREEKASAEWVSHLKDEVDDLKAKLEDAESKLKELTGVADEFEKENRTLRNDRDVAMRKLEKAEAIIAATKKALLP